MNRLEQLPEITDSVLSGLRADDALKHRILQKAVDTPAPAETRSSRRPLVALLSLSAAMIAVFVLLGTVSPVSRDSSLSVAASQPESFSDQIHTISAGERRSGSPIGLGLIIDEAFPEEEPTPEPTEELPAEEFPAEEAE